MLGLAVPPAVTAHWRTAAGLGLAGVGVCTAYPQAVKYLVDRRAERHVEGRSPSAQLLAAAAATIEEFKLAALTDDFSDSMLLNQPELALLDGRTRAGGLQVLALTMSKPDLLAAIRRITRGKPRVKYLDNQEFWRPLYEALGGALWVEEVQDDATCEVAMLLLAAADDEQDEIVRAPALLKFFQLFKHFFECYATTELPFRLAILQPLSEAMSECGGGSDNDEEAGDLVDSPRAASITIIRVEHPPGAEEAGPFEDCTDGSGNIDAMVLVYQRFLERASEAATAATYTTGGGRDVDGDQVSSAGSKWGDAERKIGATEARSCCEPGSDEFNYVRSRRLPTQGVDFRGCAPFAMKHPPQTTASFASTPCLLHVRPYVCLPALLDADFRGHARTHAYRKSSTFMCWAPGELLFKLADAKYSCNNVEGEARVKISREEHSAPRGAAAAAGGGEPRERRVELWRHERKVYGTCACAHAHASRRVSLSVPKRVHALLTPHAGIGCV